ncbi:MAG: M28 family peptidase, partial [Solirubrobacterales bacterium]
MIDLRIWRAALLAAPLVVVVAMFSLQSRPGALRPPLPPDAFDAEAATTLTTDLAEAHPEPRPGSDQDEALGEVVEDRFAQIPSVEVSEQRFTASYGGEDVELRNLIAVLPGQSERQVALLAHRDAADGSGVASSTAATAAMLELASALSGTIHEKTLVFVSTDGGEIGALGARRFAEDYSEAHLLDAVVVLSQPASPDLSPPMVIPWSTGAESGGTQLERTATAIVRDQAERPPGDAGPLQELFRLALPSALGEQGPLIEEGLDAVRLSSAGERPLPPSRDTTEEIDGDSVERLGRSALSLLLALDAAPGQLEHGPAAYVGLAGNILPGWTLS